MERKRVNTLILHKETTQKTDIFQSLQHGQKKFAYEPK